MAKTLTRLMYRWKICIFVLIASCILFMLYLMFSLPKISDAAANNILNVQIKNFINDQPETDSIANLGPIKEPERNTKLSTDEQVSARLPSVLVTQGKTLSTTVTSIVKNDSLVQEGKWENLKKHVGVIKDSLKNKTKEGIDAFKNKTKLGDLFGVRSDGQSAKEAIFHEKIISFNVSEAVAEKYMKTLDETFTNVPTSLHYHKHAQPFIKEGRSYMDSALKVAPGACVCNGSICVCCAYMKIGQLGLDKKLCVRLTYIPQPRQPVLVAEYLVNNSSLLKESLQAFNPQEVCLGGKDSFIETCTSFTNTTVRMPSQQDTLTSVSSCVSFTLNLFMKSVAVFPAGCYLLISQSTVKDSLHMNKLGNMFVP